ncbi:MAG: hypothetical protein IMZ47_03175 [Firmicutes bacterium]|nr:hypothetical protein [Bacillota bacterium]
MKTIEEHIISEVVVDLDRLSSFRGLIESFQQELVEVIEQAFQASPDLDARREEIKAALKSLGDSSLELTTKLSEQVLRVQESVKGEKLQAVFVKGKTTWDTTALGGYVLAHPELAALKKVGKPSVAIREVK